MCVCGMVLGVVKKAENDLKWENFIVYEFHYAMEIEMENPVGGY